MVAKDLISSVFAQRRSTYDPSLDEDDAFEIFCADLILNNYDPTIEDIESRVVDGSQDGGIDGVFIYVNRVLIADNTDLSTFKHPVDVELFIIQSKNQDNFKEIPIDKISSTLPNLILDFEAKENAQGDLNEALLEAFGLWQKVVQNLAP